jgi:hypothetical protein
MTINQLWLALILFIYYVKQNNELKQIAVLFGSAQHNGQMYAVELHRKKPS